MSAFDDATAFSTPPAPKRRDLPKYVHFEKSRQGVDRYYFRKDRRSPRIRLRSAPGSVEFLKEYSDAMVGKSSRPTSFVYFATAGNKVKIGVSKNPRQRLGELKTGSSSKVRIYYVTPGDRQRERELHALFAEHRVNGEWFLFHRSIRDWIEADERVRVAAKTEVLA